MKQKTPSSPITARTVLKKQGDSNKSLQSPPQPRLRASPKAPKSPPEPSTRAKSVPTDLKDVSRAKRGAVVRSQKGREAEEAKVVVVARSRRRLGDFDLKKSEDDDPDGKKRKELQEKLEVSDNLIKSLQSEVLALKEELDKVKSLNVELETQNAKLTRNLAAAEAKEATVGIGNSGKESIGEHQSPKFKDIQKLIADKLELSRVKKEGAPEVNFAKASIPEMDGSNYNSWADQWDDGPDPVTVGSNNKKSNGNAAKYKEKLGEGFGKTKAVASTGAKKLKDGASLGLHWIKTKYSKATHKN